MLRFSIEEVGGAVLWLHYILTKSDRGIGETDFLSQIQDTSLVDIGRFENTPAEVSLRNYRNGTTICKCGNNYRLRNPESLGADGLLAAQVIVQQKPYTDLRQSNTLEVGFCDDQPTCLRNAGAAKNPATAKVISFNVFRGDSISFIAHLRKAPDLIARRFGWTAQVSIPSGT